MNTIAAVSFALLGIALIAGGATFSPDFDPNFGAKCGLFGLLFIIGSPLLIPDRP